MTTCPVVCSMVPSLPFDTYFTHPCTKYNALSASAHVSEWAYVITFIGVISRGLLVAMQLYPVLYFGPLFFYFPSPRSGTSSDPDVTTRTPMELRLRQELKQKEEELQRQTTALKALRRRVQQNSSKSRQRAKKLRERCNILSAQNTSLKADVASTSALVTKGPLTAAQQRTLVTGKRVRWTDEDVGRALGLRVLSRRAYLYVKEAMQIPLPSFTTLAERTRHFRMVPGMMDSAMWVLRATVTRLNEMERLCVISFDELCLDSRVCYDQSRDTVLEAI